MLDMHLKAAVQDGPTVALANSGIAGTDPGIINSRFIENNVFIFQVFK